jgi:TrmH family RNA methyltransferase
MSAVTSVETAPDVVGVAAMPISSLTEAVSKLGLGTVLAGIHDPATAGSILSSCAAAGGSVAIATTGTTDLFAAKPLRSGAGAHFVLSIVPDVSPEQCVDALKSAGARVVAVDVDGIPPERADLSDGPLAVVVSEDAPLPDPLAHALDALVGTGAQPSDIRPSPAAEAAVVLFATARRRGAAGDR